MYAALLVLIGHGEDLLQAVKFSDAYAVFSVTRVPVGYVLNDL